MARRDRDHVRRVRDGDDGLSGEVCCQVDVFLTEQSRLLPIKVDYADHFVVLEHWNA